MHQSVPPVGTSVLWYHCVLMFKFYFIFLSLEDNSSGVEPSYRHPYVLALLMCRSLHLSAHFSSSPSPHLLQQRDASLHLLLCHPSEEQYLLHCSLTPSSTMHSVTKWVTVSSTARSPPPRQQNLAYTSASEYSSYIGTGGLLQVYYSISPHPHCSPYFSTAAAWSYHPPPSSTLPPPIYSLPCPPPPHS